MRRRTKDAEEKKELVTVRRGERIGTEEWTGGGSGVGER